MPPDRIDMDDPNIIGYAENQQNQGVCIITAPGETINWIQLVLFDTFDQDRVVIATPVEIIRGLELGKQREGYLSSIVIKSLQIAERHFSKDIDPWTRFMETDDEEPEHE